MYCKYLTKALNGKIKCRLYKRYIITLSECKSCSELNLVRNRGINKVGKNREFVTQETYDQVFKRDNGVCRLCGTSKYLQLHHINGRGKNLTNNINNCIMLCQNCHINIVHKNNKKYRKILQGMIDNDTKV